MLLTMMLVVGFQDWGWLDTAHVVSLNLFDSSDLFAAPLELDADGEGNLYIADVRANQVVKVSPQGEILCSFGRKGQGPGEFTTVYDIAVDKQRGRVWVADQIGRRVACYDLEGTLLLHRNISQIQPFAITCLSNGKLIIGGTGSNNLMMFNQELELEKPIGRTTAQPMETTSRSSHTSRLMTLVSEGDLFWVAYYNEPTLACYDGNGNLQWEKSRPWLNPEIEPIKTQLTEGGMAFEAEDYHRNLFVREGVVYVSTAAKEHGVLAMDAKTGQFLGFKNTPDLYLRGLCHVGNHVYSLSPTEGTFRVHSFSSEANGYSLKTSPAYAHRHNVPLTRVSGEKGKTSCSDSGACTCNHAGSKKCTAGCCSE